MTDKMDDGEWATGKMQESSKNQSSYSPTAFPDSSNFPGYGLAYPFANVANTGKTNEEDGFLGNLLKFFGG